MDVLPKESVEVNFFGGRVTICVIVTVGRNMMPGKVMGMRTVVVLQAVLFPVNGNGSRASKTWCAAELVPCRVTSVVVLMQLGQGIASSGNEDPAAP